MIRTFIAFLLPISVLLQNMLACEHRIAYKLCAVDVLAVELYGGYLMIVVGGVIIYSLVGVVAGGVNGYLVSALYLAAPDR